MHLSTLILSLSLSLSLSTALPTNNTTHLSKRSHAWVGSFTSADCSGDPDPAGQRPKIADYTDSCTPFEFVVGDSVGVNFGSGIDVFEGVDFFSDAHCKTVSEFHNWRTVVPGPSGMACVKPKAGVVVGSVKGTNNVQSS